nr:flippase-like domain-containing protein [Azoarcus sp. CIB]
MTNGSSVAARSLFALCAVVVLYAAVLILGGVGAILDACYRVGFSGAVALLLLSLTNLALRFVRWFVLLGCGRKGVGIGRLIWVYLSGFAFSISPGKLGEVFRGVLLKRCGVSHEVNFSLFVCERALDLIAVLAMAAIGTLYVSDFGGVYVFVPATAMLVTFVLVLRTGMFDRLHKGTRDASSRLLRFIHFVSGALALVRHSLFSRRAAIGLLLGLGAWSASAFGLSIIVQSQSYEVGFLQAVGIFALSMLGAALAGVVGGVGGAESVMVLGLTAAGILLPEAIAVTMISRVTTIGVSVSVGVFALFVAARACREKGLGGEEV